MITNTFGGYYIQVDQPNCILFFFQQAEFPAAQLHLGGHQQGDGQAEDDQEQGGDRGENPESKIAPLCTLLSTHEVHLLLQTDLPLQADMHCNAMQCNAIHCNAMQAHCR